MNDMFEHRSASPMLIGKEGPPIDSKEYIHELKLDGIRCLAYLDKDSTSLYNKRNIHVSGIYPELASIHRQVKKRCILDGELLVMKDGRPAFAEIQRRSLMSNPFRIQLTAEQLPVSFTAFDILYLDGRQVAELPLMERKALLFDVVKEESERLSVSRFVEEHGSALYALAEQNHLEGIVCKRKDSRYYFGKRTRNWVKAKNMQDDDFLICGYIPKSDGVASLVLGQYGSGGQLLYKGHVTLGVSKDDLQKLFSSPRAIQPLFQTIPSGNERAVWIKPLVGTVRYMEKTASGSLRQPIFKGLRTDKTAEECQNDKHPHAQD